MAIDQNVADTAPKPVRLGFHYDWRAGDKIPPLNVARFPLIETAHHWFMKDYGSTRWHHADTHQAMLRWKGTTYNLARVLIAHESFYSSNPPPHVNSCGLPECVKPQHWMRVKEPPNPYILETRGRRVVVTRGGAPLSKDAIVCVVNPDDLRFVHVVRVLIDEVGQQQLKVLCGASIRATWLTTTRVGTCPYCIT